MTSTLYVALMLPAVLETWQVYLALSCGCRFFNVRVHCGRRPGRGPASRVWSFHHVMMGSGFPVAGHLSRTEEPTGCSRTRRRILVGRLKRGFTAEGDEEAWLRERHH